MSDVFCRRSVCVDLAQHGPLSFRVDGDHSFSKSARCVKQASSRCTSSVGDSCCIRSTIGFLRFSLRFLQHRYRLSFSVVILVQQSRSNWGRLALSSNSNLRAHKTSQRESCHAQNAYLAWKDTSEASCGGTQAARTVFLHSMSTFLRSALFILSQSAPFKSEKHQNTGYRIGRSGQIGSLRAQF